MIGATVICERVHACRRRLRRLLVDLLRSYAEDHMKSWRVSDKVGNARSNWAELIEPVPEDAPKQQKAKRTKPKKELPLGLFD